MKESTKSNTEESPSYFMGLFCIFAFIVFIITISCAVTQMNISIGNKKRETRQLKHIAYWQTQRPELQPLIIKAKKDGKITQEEYDEIANSYMGDLRYEANDPKLDEISLEQLRVFVNLRKRGPGSKLVSQVVGDGIITTWEYRDMRKEWDLLEKQRLMNELRALEDNQ